MEASGPRSLQQYLDRAAITDVLFLAARLLDDNDLDALPRAFTADCVAV